MRGKCGCQEVNKDYFRNNVFYPILDLLDEQFKGSSGREGKHLKEESVSLIIRARQCSGVFSETDLCKCLYSAVLDVV